MLEVDLKKVAAPDLTMTIRPGTPAVVVIDEKAIPDTYWEAREPRLDRAVRGCEEALEHLATLCVVDDGRRLGGAEEIEANAFARPPPGREDAV